MYGLPMYGSDLSISVRLLFSRVQTQEGGACSKVVGVCGYSILYLVTSRRLRCHRQRERERERQGAQHVTMQFCQPTLWPRFVTQRCARDGGNIGEDIGHIVCSRVTSVFTGLSRTLVNIPMSQLRIIACRKLLTRNCGIPPMPVFLTDLARLTYN